MATTGQSTAATVRQLAKLLADIDGRLKRLESGARTGQLQHASMTGTAITVYDEDGSTPRGAIGIQPDGTIGLVAVGGPAPEAPTAPVVTSAIGGLRVVWDGALADGSELPADFDHVAVHVSTTSGFTPSVATFVGTITKAGSGGMLPVTPLPYQIHYVVLVGVTTSAVDSEPSTETAATPVQVTGPDLTAGSVTAAAIHAGAVTADKLEAILTLASRIVAGDPSAARVELNADGLRVYNADNELTIQFDAADGSGAFTGTVSGSSIMGGTVTGAIVQTAASGERIVVTPHPPSPFVDRPTVLIYSDTTGELYPASLNSGPSAGDATVPVLTMATAVVDADSATAWLSLAAPNNGTHGGVFELLTNSEGESSPEGYSIVRGRSADTSSGYSFVNIEAQNGADEGHGTSTIFVTGELINLTANGVDNIWTENGLAISGSVTAANINSGRAQIPAPGSGGGTTTVNVTFATAMPATPRVVLTADTTVDPGINQIILYADNISTTGFTIRGCRETNAATNVNWIAVS